MAQKGLG